jgi:predicted RNA binding protein YcfA (HicA-like mRNA interferase family)
MAGITPIDHKRLEKVALAVGCHFVRQKGDHRVYWRSDLKRPVIIPTYKAVPVFIIKNNLRLLGISPEEYLRILQTI